MIRCVARELWRSHEMVFIIQFRADTDRARSKVCSLETQQELHQYQGYCDTLSVDSGLDVATTAANPRTSLLLVRAHSAALRGTWIKQQQ